MRYTQDSGVRRQGDSDEYKVVVSVYLAPGERDLWGAGKARLALESTDAARPAEPGWYLPDPQSPDGWRKLSEHGVTAIEYNAAQAGAPRVHAVPVIPGWYGEPAVRMEHGRVTGRSIGPCPHDPHCDLYQCRGPGSGGRPVGGLAPAVEPGSSPAPEITARESGR